MILDEFLIKLGVVSDTKKLAEFKEGLSAITTTATAVVATVAGLTAGVTAFFGSALSGLDDLANLAADTDTDLEYIQKLGYAASLSGSSVEAANSSIKGLAQVIGEAAQGMGRGEAAFKKLGLSARNADGSVRSVSDVMEEVSVRMQGLSRSEQLNMLSKLGIDQTMVGLLSSASGEMAELFAEAEALGLVTAHGADAAAEYNDALDQMKHVTGALRTNIAIGLAPQLTILMSGMKDWLIQNKELVQNGINKLVEWVLAIGKAIINFIRAINQVIESTIGWDGALKILIGTLLILKRGLVIAFAANPVFWIAAAIAGLIVLVDDLFTFLNGGQSAFDWSWAIPIIEKFKPIIEKLDASFTKFFNSISRLGRVIFNYLKKWWSEYGETVINGLGELINAFSGFVSFVSNVIGMLVAILTGDWNLFFEHLNAAWEDAKVVFDAVIETFKSAFKAFLGLFDIDLDKAVSSFKSAGNKIKSAWSGTVGFMKSAFSRAGDFITDMWDGFKNTVSTGINYITSLFNIFTSYISNIFSAIVALLTGDWDGFVDSWKAAFQDGVNFFKSIFSGLRQFTKAILGLIGIDIDGMVSSFKSAGNKIKSAWSGTVGFMKSIFSSASNFITNVWDGFTSAVTAGIDKISSLFETCTSYISNIFSAVVSLLTGDWDGFVEGMKSALQDLINFWMSIFAGIWQYVQTILNFMGVDVDALVAVFDTAGQTIKDAWDSVMGLLSSAWDKTMGVIMKGVDAVKGALNWIGDKLGITSKEVDDVQKKADSVVKDVQATSYEAIKSVNTTASSPVPSYAAVSGASNNGVKKTDISNNINATTTINVKSDDGKAVADLLSKQLEISLKRSTENAMGPFKQ